MAPRDKELFDVLLRSIERTKAELNVSMPGTVVAYDSKRQSVDVQPDVRRRAVPEGDAQRLPVVTNVPVGFFRAGGMAVFLPVKVGNRVTLIFSDRSIERWLDGTRLPDGSVDPEDTRKHDFSDAIAFPAVYPYDEAAPFGETNPDEVENNLVIGLDDGTGTVQITPDGKVFLGSGAPGFSVGLAENIEARLVALEAFMNAHVHPALTTEALITAFIAWANGHGHAALGAPPSAPFVPSAPPGLPTAPVLAPFTPPPDPLGSNQVKVDKD